MTVLQRLVLPVDRDLDVLKLYVDETSHRQEEGASRTSTVLGRHSLSVPGSRRVSFCTYFNAFPASYWRRWTVVEEVLLRVRVRGPAHVIVYRSSGKGHAQRVASAETVNDVVEVPLPLDPFIDGGWYWFDVIAGKDGAVVEGAEWSADGIPAERGSATVGITTYNRPGFCVDQLLALGDSPDVLELLDEIIVIDQGVKRVEDHPDFPAAARALGSRLRIIDQANLGGSGGFARAMAETLQAERSDYVLLLDDDVVTEPEGVIRAITFADLTRTPTIVGGHMFDLYDRSVLHTFGEGVEPYRWFYRPAHHTHYGHDFAHAPLRTTPWLHRRADVDYNAWWMCLIPVDVIRKIGLALPLFIKWDDAEYGVRAKRAGFPTVSLPGAAVWHVPWHEKDDTLDWQAYYHARNRLITALLHSPYERGGTLVRESMLITAKHVLAMQYSTAELVCQALEDILAGPAHLHESLAAKIGQIRATRQDYPDARAAEHVEDFPDVRRRRPPRKGREFAVPEGRRAMVRTALGAALKQLRPVDDFARRHPQAAVPHVDQRWWLLAQLDSALVSSADGTRVSWYQRDPARYRSLAVRSSVLHARLLREWPRLSRVYRAALAELVSPESWRDTFETRP
ncbi:glycosyltransferase [Actinoallomurus spadix]|uniref:Glycosyltransferase n=1 Tax=Actinoallomurus spadix TaxID=79912 RepID=A0ABN0VVB8_9ACTN|nr:glycosyltransferase [Actinoallomurus spadix]MCO5985784.1 glycosyltransferase [Actinoallomurus spadix]